MHKNNIIAAITKTLKILLRRNRRNCFACRLKCCVFLSAVSICLRLKLSKIMLYDTRIHKISVGNILLFFLKWNVNIATFSLEHKDSLKKEVLRSTLFNFIVIKMGYLPLIKLIKMRNISVSTKVQNEIPN